MAGTDTTGTDMTGTDMTGTDDVSAQFAGWLYRPFVDLAPWEAGGNPVTLALSNAARALRQGRDDGVMQNTGIAPPSFRRSLLRATGLTRHLVTDPRDLDPGLRTPTWQLLCDHLDAYLELDAAARLRTLLLLHRLTLQSAILHCEEVRLQRHTSGTPSGERSGAPRDGAADLMRGLARLQLFQDGHGTLDLTDLAALESTAALGSYEHVEATYALAQSSAKILSDVPALARQLEHHRASIDAVDRTDHERTKLLSRYHRLAAFLPQLTGDLDGMVRHMDDAERHCDQMSRDEPRTRADWEVFRYALLESRVKERFAREDFPGAERYAAALVDHAPSVPNARLTLGQARIECGDVEGALTSYRSAALLGPHVAAEAEFMAGQCLEHLGRPDEARDAYVRSLAADPLAVSAAERLHASGPAPSHTYLDVWADRRRRTITEASPEPATVPNAYQTYAGILGSQR